MPRNAAAVRSRTSARFAGAALPFRVLRAPHQPVLRARTLPDFRFLLEFPFAVVEFTKESGVQAGVMRAFEDDCSGSDCPCVVASSVGRRERHRREPVAEGRRLEAAKIGEFGLRVPAETAFAVANRLAVAGNPQMRRLRCGHGHRTAVLGRERARRRSVSAT